MKFSVFCISALLLSSCSLKNVDNNTVNDVFTSDIVAEVNGEMIKSSELEQSVSQQVFDELNRIYQIRSIALDYLIDEKIIEQEAKRNNMSSNEYLENYYNSIVAKTNTDSLLYSLGVKDVTAIKGTSMVNMDKSSHEGRIASDKVLKLSLKKQLLDSLKSNNSEIYKYVYPPRSSKFNLTGLPVYYRGNLDSKVSMVVVSDFECDRCIQAHEKYNDIYEKYKDKVKFGSLSFTSYPTFASLSADAAHKQGKYWEFSDSLFAKRGAIDSLGVYSIAKGLNLDMGKFSRDLHSQSTLEALTNVNDELVRKGMFATPTIIINGRLIFDSNSKKEITHLLDEELNK